MIFPGPGNLCATKDEALSSNQSPFKTNEARFREINLFPLFFRTYTEIVSSDQRSRYKADFNEQYQEYLRLHSYIEERTRPFSDLDERLRNETIGSEEYNVREPFQ